MSYDDVYSHRLGPAEKRKKWRSPKTSLPKASSETVAHIEQKYALLRLHVTYAKKQETAQLKGLFTGDGSRGILHR